jgi:hypothetical protein
MKSGAKVARRADLLIVGTAGVMNALKADEIIKAANDKRVNIDVKDGDSCGGSTVAAMPPASSSTAATQNGSAPASAVAPASSSRLGEMFDGSSPYLILAAILGLIALGFGIYTLTRRQAAHDEWEPASAGPDPAPAGESPPSRTATSLSPSVGETKVGESTLRLTGRGPAGEPIELSFASSALQAEGMTIGVGTNAQARIPDNRTDHRVSRLHARIAYDGRHFTIEDNKSLNKTFVGGQAIESHVPTRLVNGERIRLADIELSVSIS